LFWIVPATRIINHSYAPGGGGSLKITPHKINEAIIKRIISIISLAPGKL
jgi:hypothetical protein